MFMTPFSHVGVLLLLVSTTLQFINILENLSNTNIVLYCTIAVYPTVTYVRYRSMLRLLAEEPKCHRDCLDSASVDLRQLAQAPPSFPPTTTNNSPQQHEDDARSSTPQLVSPKSIVSARITNQQSLFLLNRTGTHKVFIVAPLRHELD